MHIGWSEKIYNCTDSSAYENINKKIQKLQQDNCTSG